jgi:hypothetical protein
MFPRNLHSFMQIASLAADPIRIINVLRIHGFNVYFPRLSCLRVCLQDLTVHVQFVIKYSATDKRVWRLSLLFLLPVYPSILFAMYTLA